MKIKVGIEKHGRCWMQPPHGERLYFKLGELPISFFKEGEPMNAFFNELMEGIAQATAEVTKTERRLTEEDDKLLVIAKDEQKD